MYDAILYFHSVIHEICRLCILTRLIYINQRYDHLPDYFSRGVRGINHPSDANCVFLIDVIFILSLTSAKIISRIFIAQHKICPAYA